MDHPLSERQILERFKAIFRVMFMKVVAKQQPGIRSCDVNTITKESSTGNRSLHFYCRDFKVSFDIDQIISEVYNAPTEDPVRIVAEAQYRSTFRYLL